MTFHSFLRTKAELWCVEMQTEMELQLGHDGGQKTVDMVQISTL